MNICIMNKMHICSYFRLVLEATNKQTNKQTFNNVFIKEPSSAKLS